MTHYTEEEVRLKFLEQAKVIAHYWANTVDGGSTQD